MKLSTTVLALCATGASALGPFAITSVTATKTVTVKTTVTPTSYTTSYAFAVGYSCETTAPPGKRAAVTPAPIPRAAVPNPDDIEARAPVVVDSTTTETFLETVTKTKTKTAPAVTSTVFADATYFYVLNKATNLYASHPSFYYFNATQAEATAFTLTAGFSDQCQLAVGPDYDYVSAPNKNPSYLGGTAPNSVGVVTCHIDPSKSNKLFCNQADNPALSVTSVCVGNRWALASSNGAKKCKAVDLYAIPFA